MLYIIESQDSAYVSAVHGMLQKEFIGFADVFNSSKVVYATDVRVAQRAVVKYISDTNAANLKAFGKEVPIYIITTSIAFVKSLFPTLEGTAADNEGIVFLLGNARCILMPSFSHMYTVPSFNFMTMHWVRKLTKTDASILEKDKFTWVKVERVADFDKALRAARVATLCAIDIETGPKEFLVITSCSYTFLVGSGTITFVIPVTSLQEIKWIRQLNATEVPKVMQNGRYDCTYFLRFNAPVTNYFFDTYVMFHCMYQELPKDIAFMSSFFLQDFVFWKDEAKVNLYEYNGKDTHNTLWVFIAQLKHMKYYTPYAFKNYMHEFPLLFPFLACQLEGIKIDLKALDTANTALTLEATTASKELQYLLGIPDFNASSSKQVKLMLNCLEEFFPPSQRKQHACADAAELKNWSYRHPLYHRVYEKIIAARKALKLTSTYLKEDKFIAGRLLARFDASGTETGRSSSSASDFWVGHNIQNIPASVKDIYIADEGFTLFEVDKSQAESWCTGYLSGNTKLIKILNESPDFHCTNASMFFGIPFDQLYDAVNHKKLNTEIRDLAKRVNHGANYNMSAITLLTTMGIKNILKAQKLLGLPLVWTPLRIAAHLLEQFDKQYAGLRDKTSGYYAKVIKEVMDTGKLVGPTGYTRRTFLNPTASKHALNTLVAHPSQSLSVLLVNKAFLKIFIKTLHEWDGLVRLKAQIHDSILGEVVAGREDIVYEIEKIMRIPVLIHGREMIIPGDAGKLGKTVWKQMK